MFNKIDDRLAKELIEKNQSLRVVNDAHQGDRHHRNHYDDTNWTASQEAYNIKLAGFGYLMAEAHPEFNAASVHQMTTKLTGIKETSDETARDRYLKDEENSNHLEVPGTGYSVFAGLAVGAIAFCFTHGDYFPGIAFLGTFATVAFGGKQLSHNIFEKKHGITNDEYSRKLTKEYEAAKTKDNTRHYTEHAIEALKNNDPEIFNKHPKAAIYAENLLLDVLNAKQFKPQPV